ncbi:MAG: DUF4856 domain-containing protein, partial [Aliarcobacter cryaerophilus]
VMQHHWDEAYGYFTSEFDFPTNGTNRFWGKYADVVDGVLGSSNTISLAFRKGRSAINNNDYTVRDAQTVIIVDEMEKICAGSAIHYLNGAKLVKEAVNSYRDDVQTQNFPSKEEEY